MFSRSTASQSSYMNTNNYMRVTLSRKFIFDKVSGANQYELRVDLFQEGDKHYFKDEKLAYKVRKTYQDFLVLHDIVKNNPKYPNLLKRGLPSIMEF